MAVTESTVEAPPAAPAELAPAHRDGFIPAAQAELSAIERFVGTVDHKQIGRRYTVTALLVTAVGFIVRALGWAGANGSDALLGGWSLQVHESADLAVVVLGVLALIVGIAALVEDIYSHIAAGRLRAIRVGGRRVIPADSLHALMAGEA